MKIFVLGATGRTGQELVQQALARGQGVTAFVRSPEKIAVSHERLTVVPGNILDETHLGDALRGHDAVVSALGPTEPFKPATLLHDSAVATAHAMNHANVKRLVALSAAAHFPGIPNQIVSFILRHHMRDSLAMERVIQSSGLEWTLARPPTLTQGKYLTYRSRENAAPSGGFFLSRTALAAFMLDSIEQRKHFQKIVGVAK